MLTVQSNHTMKAAAAEFIGTFALVFAGTGAIVINEVSGGAITHVGVALTFGLAKDRVVSTIDVEWPSGMKDHLMNVPANQSLTIEEGGGIVRR